MMKAWVLNKVGDISFQAVDVPAPAENEVLIRVEAAGICESDIPRIYKTGAHRMSLIPGHELSGVVEGIGKQVPAYWLGRRVAVCPKIACGKCKQCRDGYFDFCKEYDFIGSRRDGAFAEYVAVPTGNLLELPETVSFAQGAMLEPLAVAANAVWRGCQGMSDPLSLEKPVAVCGLGPVGLMAVMLLKEAGYRRIFVIGKGEGQRKRAGKLGISEKHFCDSQTEDAGEWLLNISDGGASVYFECAGTNESMSYGFEGLAPGGRRVTVGNPRCDMAFPRGLWWMRLRKQMTVYGIWNSSF